jgi:hypothetical protein
MNENQKKWLGYAIVVAAILISNVVFGYVIPYPSPPLESFTMQGVTNFDEIHLGANSGTATPALMVDQDGAGVIFEVRDAATPVFSINDGGGVALGTGGDLTVADTLDVNGDIDLDGDGFDVDITAGFSVDGDAASNVSVAGAGIDLTLASAAGRVVIQGSEAAADAVYIDADGAAGVGLDIDVGSTGGVSIDGGMLDVGTGSCAVADGDNDVCIAAVLEVDGEIEADGAVDMDAGATIDGGVTNIGGGSPDVAQGDNDLFVTADLEVDGEIEVDGTMDIDGATTLAATLTVEAGGKVKPSTTTTGTVGMVFVVSGVHTHASTETAVSILEIPANANVVDTMYLITTDWNDGGTATVDCGIKGGDTDAFIDGLDLNGVGDGTFSRMGAAAENEVLTAIGDVGASDVDVICQVAEGNNDASEGSATLYIWYVID